MRYARIEDGAVAEVVSVPPGLDVKDMFAPGLVASMIAVDNSVAPGWLMWKGKLVSPETLEREREAERAAREAPPPAPAPEEDTSAVKRTRKGK